MTKHFTPSFLTSLALASFTLLSPTAQAQSVVLQNSSENRQAQVEKALKECGQTSSEAPPSKELNDCMFNKGFMRPSVVAPTSITTPSSPLAPTPGPLESLRGGMSVPGLSTPLKP